MTDRLHTGPVDLEVLRRGRGRPILLLHGINPVSPKAPFLDLLAAHGEVIAPSHPGFGASPRPDDFDTMYDLVHLYREVLDALPEKAVVIGFSFGGWIAAEVAAQGHPKLDRLVLADPVGIKLAGRDERDIAHFFNTNPATLAGLAWHDQGKRPAGVYGLGWQTAIDEAMPDADMVALARNWDALCLYAWRPHMYNPQLKHWLRRIAAPALVLWGDSDGIVTPDYGRRYAGLIPGARFELIERAGPPPRTRAAAGFRRAGRAVCGAIGMMFIVRSTGKRPEADGMQVKLTRDTPATVKDAAGKIDFFCTGDDDAMSRLRDAGWQVVELRDGYYEDGSGGGVGIWGQGRYWEIRDDAVHRQGSGRPGGRCRIRQGRGRAGQRPRRHLRRVRRNPAELTSSFATARRHLTGAGKGRSCAPEPFGSAA